MIKIAPSILSSDFTVLGETVKKLEKAGADYIHLDVMDGSFVPQITFGAKVAKDLKRITKLPLDVHLMIINPEKHIDGFLNSGADIITIHQETTDNLRGLLQKIKDSGVKCSVSIKPNTGIETIEKVLDLVDMILIMTVEPGFGGQDLIEKTLAKVSNLSNIKKEKNYDYDIQVDGGINSSTYFKAIAAGANILVAGSAITSSDDYAKTISKLKGER